MYHAFFNFRRWLFCGLACLFAAGNVAAFVSGGKEWPDSFSISGSWSYVMTGETKFRGMQGSVNWTLSGTAVERSPGIWAYRVNYTIQRTRQRKKDPTTSIPNSYILTPHLYVHVHHSFLPFGPNDSPSFGAAGLVQIGGDIPAWWDPVPTDGVYTVTGNVESSMASKPATFSRSISITAEKYHYSFHNNTDKMRTYEIRDHNGDLIKRMVLPPGGKETGTFSGSGGGEPYANSGPSGGFGAFDGSTGYKLDNSNQLHPVNSYDPEKDYIDVENSTTEPINKLPNQNSEPPASPATGPDPLIWDRPSDASKNLTDDIFRVGTKAITDRLDALIKKPTGGGGGDTEVNVDVDMSGVENRLDSANEKLTSIEEHNAAILEEANRRKAEELAAQEANPADGEAESAGSAASTAAATAWGSFSVPVPTPSGTPPLFVVADPFTGQSFDLNPFTADRFGGVAEWLRSLALWLLVVGFAGYAVSVASDTIRDVAQAQQAKGNTVVAGTGAQATALIAAAGITVVVLGVIVAMAAWKDITLSGSGGSIVSVLGMDPFASAPAACVWMIDQIFPIGTALAVLVAKISFRSAATVSYVTAAAIIRFIVP